MYMKKILKQLSMIAFGTSIFTLVPLVLIASPQRELSNESDGRKSNNAVIEQTTQVPLGVIPPIDVYDDSGFQTATFALG